MECFHRDSAPVEKQGSIGSDLTFEAVLWEPQSTVWQPQRTRGGLHCKLPEKTGNLIPASEHEGTLCVAVNNP